MKILLTALNAKYIHTALALYCLKAYAKEFQQHIVIEEYTINHQEDFILQQIYRQQPDVVCFSCYLWNISQISRIVDNLKKILPHVMIILGGAEVSYEPEQTLQQIPADIIIRGEGEATFYEIIKGLITNTLSLENIDGITYRKGNTIISNANRAAIALDDLPFVYDDIKPFQHRILYYETQRGCPYNCQYCLSSIEKGVRFLSKKRVEKDLQFFLDNYVTQVKFVDRTFNANAEHANYIWSYLIEHDNGVTNFHMEITADILQQESLQILKKARKGLFQFEIGVQSTNTKTIQAIQRNTSFEKLKAVVKQIKNYGNIHQHLDLIAGLPYEDYASFRNSFNDVYMLQPEQFQLGFLKLLKGSGLRKDAEKYGIVYRKDAVYEVLYTKELKCDDIFRLKQIEDMVETYYNSGKACKTIEYAISFFETPFDFYEALGDYWIEKRYNEMQHSKIELYTILYHFVCDTECTAQHKDIFKEYLKLDIFMNDNVKTLPDWLIEEEQEKQKRWEYYNNTALIKHKAVHLSEQTPKQLSKRCHICFLEYDIFSESKYKKQIVILFDYGKRDILTKKYHYYQLV
ncbi:B12-binding domain-containing radical SAM protein [Clostridium sp. MD294]|uniref:B12-binding domain-containing radical SAM protein n=1 Tax=Clostridium sp. MD294 TaxID=97138 RepID=UPI0002CB542C|nr:B12-binding domain-containing radical SAM protein [Clostridium sp. MD294]USF28957.1 hypothetical protein C820_000340 [Clostridium sp. MD294]